MSSATQTQGRTFRDLYACHLTREKIYQELVAPRKGDADPHFAPGFGNLLPGAPVPTGPHDLPRYRDPPPALLPGPLKFCIVGAGAAGLFTAMILSDLEISYDFFEGSDRFGGRMFTKYFGQGQDSDWHDYYDVGAMRYPDIPPMKL